MIVALSLIGRASIATMRAAPAVATLLRRGSTPGRALALANPYALVTSGVGSGFSMDFSQPANSGYVALISI